MSIKGWGVIFLIGSAISCSQKQNNKDIKDLVMTQLHNTHTNQEWFVPTNIALEGLTYEQAIWKDSIANHSIAELVSHITFWSEMNLRSFKNLKTTEQEIINDETFRTPSEKEWLQTLKRLDSIQRKWETSVKESNDIKLKDWSDEIVNMSAHTSYHTGQIVFIRKQNGWWK